MPVDLDAAIQHIKAGHPAKARQLLVDLLRADPKNETAWMWLSSVVDDDRQRKDCLERVLALDPANEAARLQLTQMQRSAVLSKVNDLAFQQSHPVSSSRSRQAEAIETSLVTLACPSCGSALQVTPDRDTFVCPACGNSHVVRRSAGLVALEPVLEEMREMRAEVNRSSREINIHHLHDDITALEKAKGPHHKGLLDGVKIVLVAVVILIFLNIGFFFQPLIILGLFMLAGGLGWTSYHFIRQRQIDTDIQMKQLEIIRERNL
jgi:predicted RNA-binding Zn-ribbon protein involved in translation (DUF1610 family)